MLLASQWIPNLLPYVLSFAAGNFMYVAMADLIPDLHRGGIGGGPFRQLLLIVAGVATIEVRRTTTASATRRECMAMRILSVVGS